MADLTVAALAARRDVPRKRPPEINSRTSKYTSIFEAVPT
jgi:hypothetical protein